MNLFRRVGCGEDGEVDGHRYSVLAGGVEDRKGDGEGTGIDELEAEVGQVEGVSGEDRSGGEGFQRKCYEGLIQRNQIGIGGGSQGRQGKVHREVSLD